MNKKIILSLIIILSIGFAFAQAVINFPSNFEITIPQLALQQSPNQIIFNCPYDSNIEYKMVGIRNLTWNGNLPTVTADVKYWTKNRSCAGSKKFNFTLPITISQGALLTNFQNRINTEFINEALANTQAINSSQSYISTSSGAG